MAGAAVQPNSPIYRMSQLHILTHSHLHSLHRVNAESGEPPSTESSTSSPVEMAVGEEDSVTSATSKPSETTPTGLAPPPPANPYQPLDNMQNTSGLVTMETVLPGGEGGEVVGGMSQHNGLPGYSPPRPRGDSETTLDVREGVEPLDGDEEEDDDET